MNRRAHYEYLKSRMESFSRQVKKLLGGVCEKCGAENPTRIDFRNYNYPGRTKHIANRATLYRKVLDGEINSRELHLLCSDCWIDWRQDAKTSVPMHEVRQAVS